MDIRTMRHRGLDSFVFALAGLAALASTAHAQVSCGTTFTSTTVTMTADIVGCAVDPVVTLVDSTLDMDGYSITGCTGDGVHLLGSNSRVENGTISGCVNGVVLDGTGGHDVENLRSESNSAAGFLFNSGSNTNRLEYTSSSGNAVGWDIASGSDRHTIRYSMSVSDTQAAIVGGDRSKLRDSAAAQSVSAIQIDGDRNDLRDFVLVETPVIVNGDSNKIRDVTSIGAGTEDLFTVAGVANRLEKTRIANFNSGILLTGDAARVSRVSMAGGSQTGVAIEATNNDVTRSFIAASGQYGVDAASTSAGNTIDRNTVVFHSVFDLRDADALCVNNTWQNNVEATKDPSCLD
jgi:hypothetical protein